MATFSSIDPAVVLEAASVEFSSGKRAADQVKAVDAVDLSVARGERFAIVGQSGCGKTTLLRVIAGLQKLSQGRCLGEHSGGTSFVFQQPALLPWRRVMSNVMLPLQLLARSASTAEKRQAVRSALEEVELNDSAERFPYQLSGGMKMRVSIARALVTQPDLLLLDEPFAALDDVLRNQLGDLVTRLWHRHRFTMILVTHNIAEAIVLSERICVMQDGRVQSILENPIAQSVRSSNPEHGQDIRRTPEFAAFYGRVSDCLRTTAGK